MIQKRNTKLEDFFLQQAKEFQKRIFPERRLIFFLN